MYNVLEFNGLNEFNGVVVSSSMHSKCQHECVCVCVCVAMVWILDRMVSFGGLFHFLGQWLFCIFSVFLGRRERVAGYVPQV